MPFVNDLLDHNRMQLGLGDSRSVGLTVFLPLRFMFDAIEKSEY